MDTAAGVIRGVKVLGLISQNGRRYLPAAIAKAAPLYEGIGVFLDHPARPNEQRSARDRIGWLEKVQVQNDGLYADLHLLTSDPTAAKILEAAQKRPDLFGLSHNAEGKGTHEAGVFVVAEITEVKSVDLVADPATNRSLFEGTTIATELREDDAKKDEPSWKDKLNEAIGKLCESDDESDKALGDKLKKAMDAEPTKEQDEDDNDADSASQEGKKIKTPAPGAIALTEQQVQKLLKMNGLEATAELMEALQGADLDQATAIMAIAKRTAPAPRQSDPPRSTSRIAPITEGVAPKDAAGWAQKLLA